MKGRGTGVLLLVPCSLFLLLMAHTTRSQNQSSSAPSNSSTPSSSTKDASAAKKSAATSKSGPKLSLAAVQWVELTLSKMSLDEKVGQLITYSQGAATGPGTGRSDVEEFRLRMADAVKSHLVADVPVGAFLSAGIDSGALVGLMCDAGARDIETVTIAFEEFSGAAQDEAPLAQQVAAHYGTRHTTRVVTRAEFEQDLPRILEAMDQPSIDGINTWFVSKAASERGLKVAVSGLGGDELFGGYPSFADIPKWVKFMSLPSRAPGLGALARLAMAPLVERFSVSPKAAGMLELGGTYAGAWLLKRGLFLPRELREALDPDMIREGLRRLAPLQLINEAITPLPRSAFARVATLEATFYMRNQLLRDADWASMAHSLEVRVPLVDSVLLQNVAAITCARALDGKRLLAAAPGRALPAEVLARKKTGFTTPVQSWMRALVGNAGEGTGPWAREWAKYVGRRMLVRSNAPAR